ncbi:hypothetical protein BH11ARM1_BH11ARM1_10720 [soil metagenome]
MNLISILAFTALQNQAVLPDVKVWVGLYNPPPEAAITLRDWLGKGYGVTELTDAQIIKKLTSSMQDLSKKHVSIMFPPATDSKHLDAFFSALESKLTLLTTLGGPVYLCVPVGSSDFLRDYVVPLSKQAAREVGVKVIDLNNGDSFAEAAGEAVIDPRMEKKAWRLVSADSQQIDEGPAANAIDGKLDTYWHTQYDPTTPKPPHQITVDMGTAENVAGFRYVPRQDGGVNGLVKGYEFFMSPDGQTWTKVASGDFPKSNQPAKVKFAAVSARYFRFVATSERNGGPWASAAEIDVLKAR